MGNRRSEIAATTPAAASGTAQAAGSACSAKDLGGSRTRLQAIFRKSSPTVSCTSDQRLREGPCGDIQEVEPAEADEDDSHQQRAGGDLVGAQPFAIAIAPKAFSGCTGIGNPYVKAAAM